MTGQLTDQQKNARYALAVLFSINLMNFFDRQVAGALAEPVRLEFGMTDTQIGIVNTAFTLIYAFVGVPLGRLTDTWQRPRLIAIGVTFWSLLTAASGATVNFVTYLLSRIGVGVGEAGCSPPAHSLLSDYYPPERRGRAFATYALGIPIGTAFGYLLGGWMSQELGWRYAFLLVGLPGILLALIVRFTLREPQRGMSEGVRREAAPAPRTMCLAADEPPQFGPGPTRVEPLLTGVLSK